MSSIEGSHPKNRPPQQETAPKREHQLFVPFLLLSFDLVLTRACAEAMGVMPGKRAEGLADGAANPT